MLRLRFYARCAIDSYSVPELGELRFQVRVIGIARRRNLQTIPIESFGMKRIEIGIQLQTARQIGIGNKVLAEGYRVRLARSEHLLCSLAVKPLVCDEDTAKALFQFRADAFFTQRLSGEYKGNTAFAQLLGHISKSG
jgi:hypothetical protein